MFFLMDLKKTELYTIYYNSVNERPKDCKV
jgi:hypothetical protein